MKCKKKNGKRKKRQFDGNKEGTRRGKYSENRIKENERKKERQNEKRARKKKSEKKKGK